MRTITFETDFNCKLACNSFVHISFAPPSLIPEPHLNEPVKILVKDSSTEVVVNLIDILRFPFYQLTSLCTLPSHGMPCIDFVEWWKLKYPQTTSATEMAVYYYTRKH